MKVLLGLICFMIILYYLKVPSVVTFINDILIVLANVWNFTLDISMNLKERHPWIWIALPFVLIWLMIPPKENHA